MDTRLSAFRQDAGVLNLFISDCPSCGVIFGIPETLEQRRRGDGKSFYCPNGHSLSFSKSKVDKERERADLAERRLRAANTRAQMWQDQAEAAERSRRALKGHLTRMRNLIARGVCPVSGCRRNFGNVRDHIATEHTGWLHDHPGVLS